MAIVRVSAQQQCGGCGWTHSSDILAAANSRQTKGIMRARQRRCVSQSESDKISSVAQRVFFS